MARFNFPLPEAERQPLLLDDAQDNIPRLNKNHIVAAPEALHAVLEASASAEAAMIKHTIIYRRSIQQIVAEGNIQQAEGAVRKWQQGSRSAFFMIQQDGNHISVSNSAGETADLGGYKPAMYESLAKKDSFPGEISNTHTDHTSALLNIDNGTLVCETGAGLDLERIIRLARNTKERGGYLLCHDVPPLLAKVGRERIPGVPYIALPPFQEFLGKALEQYAGRKVMTMKNTLTSFAHEDVDELLRIMKVSKIERLVVSQSVGPNMDLFMPEGKATIERATQDIALKTAQERTDNRDSRNIVMVVIAERAKQIAYTALLEILFQNLTDRAAQHGYYIANKTTSTAQSDLTGTDAVLFMKGKGIDCEASFKQNIFNEVSFTPTAILYTKNLNVPLGTLRIYTTQIHLTLSRKPSDTTAISVAGRYHHGFPIPAFQALKAVAIRNLDFETLKFDPYTDRQVEEAATYSGLAVAFDLFGKVIGVPIIQQYCGTQFEREMYDTFGVSVDS